MQVLDRLRQMYVDGVRERIDEIQEKVGVKESDLEYPTLIMQQSVRTPKVVTNSEDDYKKTEKSIDQGTLKKDLQASRTRIRSKMNTPPDEALLSQVDGALENIRIVE